MNTAFSKTFLRLLSDRGHGAYWMLVCAVAVLGAWCWWAIRAQITLYEVSPSARIEMAAATYPIQSPMLGRVVATRLQVGRLVRSGEILVDIDAIPDQLQLREEAVRAQGLEPELARLHAQIEAEEKARDEEQRASVLTTAEAASRIDEAKTAAALAQTELARVRTLEQAGVSPRRDLDRAEAEARRLTEAVATLEAAARRVPREQATRDRERDATLESLKARISALEAQRGVLHASMERLGYEIERRHVRAPVGGRIGESQLLRAGAVVQQGERLASIVPTGGLLVAAQFPAESAFGRIREGQAAVLRLDGFPWAEFGSVSANVARVAQEVRDGRVRVELAIDPGSSSFRGKLEHGMPGAIEVRVERLTPLALLVRTVGKWLTAQP